MSSAFKDSSEMDQILSNYEQKLWDFDKDGNNGGKFDHFFNALMQQQINDQDSGAEDEPEINKLSNFFDYESVLNAENSGIPSDEKRHEETIRDSMQAGFQTLEKKLDMLKQGGKSIDTVTVIFKCLNNLN